MRNHFIIAIISCLLITSCVSKKEILYMQDANVYNNDTINYQNLAIQPNDILNITVDALVKETAEPYNRNTVGPQQQGSVEILKLQGYLVSKENTIQFPILGLISTSGKTTRLLEQDLRKRLEDGGHLVSPTVTVRLLNAKVTVLGEVNNPGTFSFTEESITLLQALGYAGDLNINGKRDDILIMREEGGVRRITHIDLTSGEWLSSPFYYVKPNDIIVVNPNNPKVKTAGYIGEIGTLLGVSSLVLSVIILLTR